MKMYGGADVQIHIYLTLAQVWRWMVSFTPRPLYPQRKNPWYPLYRRLHGSQVQCGLCGENSWPQTSTPQPCSQSLTECSIPAYVCTQLISIKESFCNSWIRASKNSFPRRTFRYHISYGIVHRKLIKAPVVLKFSEKASYSSVVGVPSLSKIIKRSKNGRLLDSPQLTIPYIGSYPPSLSVFTILNPEEALFSGDNGLNMRTIDQGDKIRC
jgi:hypothetical protein